MFGRQREATVLVVTVALLLYFGLTHNSTFVTQTDAVDLLSELMAPIAIIAIGEVLLLICGEIDLSVGFIYTFVLFVTLFAITDYHLPSLVAVILGRSPGWWPAGSTVDHGHAGRPVVHHHDRHRVHPAGPGPGRLARRAVADPPIALGVGKSLGVPGNPWQWAPFAWAVVLVAIFHVVLTRTRWGLSRSRPGEPARRPGGRASTWAGSSTATS